MGALTFHSPPRSIRVSIYLSFDDVVAAFKTTQNDCFYTDKMLLIVRRQVLNRWIN